MPRRLRTSLINQPQVRNVVDTYLMLGEWTATGITSAGRKLRDRAARLEKKARMEQNRRRSHLGRQGPQKDSYDTQQQHPQQSQQ